MWYVHQAQVTQALIKQCEVSITSQNSEIQTAVANKSFYKNLNLLSTVVHVCEVTQLCLTFCDPMDRLLCPWDSSGKDTAVGCHFPLQRILPIQGLNLCPFHLLHWQGFFFFFFFITRANWETQSFYMLNRNLTPLLYYLNKTKQTLLPMTVLHVSASRKHIPLSDFCSGLNSLSCWFPDPSPS